MKKFFLLVIILALVTIFITKPPYDASAAEKEQVDVYNQEKQLTKSVVFVIGKDEYFVNNQTPGVKMDAKPFIETGRTFVPVRYLSNALGVIDKNIGWESPVVTLKQPDMPLVELTIGKKEIKSDGSSKTMDVAPMIREGRTYLPARWVAEALGYEVAWDAENSVVLCYPKGTEKPDVSSVMEYLSGEETTPPVPPVVEGDTVNGYVIPKDTDLQLYTLPDTPSKGYLVFCINLKNGNPEQQYADAQSILSQTLDLDTTTKAIEYAKEGQYNEGLLPIKTFYSPNGMAARVGVGSYTNTVQIDLWSTK